MNAKPLSEIEGDAPLMDDTEVVRINIAEFRAFGYLQELNRRFLHPLGLALEVKLDDEGNETLGGIWDYRNDPEGMNYGPGVIDRDKAVRVAEEFRRLGKSRQEALGYQFQPLDGE